MDTVLHVLKGLGFDISDFQVEYTVKFSSTVQEGVACRCTHLPTGIKVESQGHRSYAENALAVVEEMLYRLGDRNE